MGPTVTLPLGDFRLDLHSNPRILGGEPLRYWDKGGYVGAFDQVALAGLKDRGVLTPAPSPDYHNATYPAAARAGLDQCTILGYLRGGLRVYESPVPQVAAIVICPAFID